MNEEKKKTNAPIVVLAVIAAVLVVFTVAVVIKTINSWNSLDETGIEEEVSPDKNNPEEFTEEIADVPDTDMVTDGEEEALPDDGSIHHLVCVPAEYMSLRKTPGLGDDVITQLYAGAYLSWDGKYETVNDDDFYFVTVDDSKEQGYVAAKFCVEMDYLYDEGALDVVQTSNPLYSYEDMETDIDKLVSMYPKLLTKETIGKSVDGRNIYEISFGNPNASQHIMLQSTIHGREYMNTQLVMKLIEYYCYYYDKGEFNGIPYNKLFDETAFHLIPMSNPDGVTISQFGTSRLNHSSISDLLHDCYDADRHNLMLEENTNGDLTWMDHYKEDDFSFSDHPDKREISFDEYLKIWKANANGVDLNNNFDAGWEEIDLKWWPSYGNFKGYYPVSEPETAALVDCATKRKYECFVSYHSMGQLIYYDVRGNTEINSQFSTKLADLFSSTMKYETVNTNKAYNVNLGGFGDWIQLELDCPSITIESGKKPCPLEIPEFEGIWNRHRETWAMLAEQFYS